MTEEPEGNGDTRVESAAKPRLPQSKIDDLEDLVPHSDTEGLGDAQLPDTEQQAQGPGRSSTPSNYDAIQAIEDEEQEETKREDDENDEEEEEEEEPRLKYQRLGSSVTEILSQDAASCLAISDKLLALGTHDGTVHVLDYAGNEVKRFEMHKSRVNDISIDEAAEYVASCSDDGSAAVHGLYTDESMRYKYTKPVKTIALDPRFGQRKTREFITGGLAGQLLLSSKGWLGTRDTVLHSGEGDVSIARWAGTHIAWANSRSVKVYDTSVHQIIGFINKPASSGSSDSSANCHLFWEQTKLLYIGWADSVQVARIVLAESSANGPGKQMLEILTSFTLEKCIIAGLAPFGLEIAVLTYVTEEDLSLDGGPQVAKTSEHQEALRPELKFVDWQNIEKASDALSIHGFEHYQANDYALAACYLPSNSLHPAAGKPMEHSQDFIKWWKPGDEPQYYLVSPKDIVVGKPRDGDDRIDWLIQYTRFEEALSILEADASLSATSHQKVAQAYLEHLLNQGKYAEAVDLFPRLLKDDAPAWERYVYIFAQLRQLPVLAPQLPVREPQLRGSAYEMVLHAFLLSPADHQQLLLLLERWPSHLYSVPSLTQAVVERIRSAGGDSEALLESAARLYQVQARYDLTLAILLRLRRERVFGFIAGHHLMPLLKGQAIAQLLDIDAPRAIRLLVDFHEEVPAQAVAPAIQAAMGDAEEHGDRESAQTWRKRLHTYLDWLFIKDPVAGAQFHSLQVELYAEYAPERLMGFLVSSQSYGLEAAHELCKQAGLVREQVFVLGRMGNSREALGLIISNLGDVLQAVEFVQTQQDDELWDLLICLAISNAAMTGALLDHVGSYIDPLRLVRRIPEGMCVDRLRDRLVTIIADFRNQTSLKQSCAALLQRDCTLLAQRLYRELQGALQPRKLFVRGADPSSSSQWWQGEDTDSPASAVDLTDLPGPCGAKQLHILANGNDQPLRAASGAEDATRSRPHTLRGREFSQYVATRSTDVQQLPSYFLA